MTEYFEVVKDLLTSHKVSQEKYEKAEEQIIWTTEKILHFANSLTVAELDKIIEETPAGALRFQLSQIKKAQNVIK